MARHLTEDTITLVIYFIQVMYLKCRLGLLSGTRGNSPTLPNEPCLCHVAVMHWTPLPRMGGMQWGQSNTNWPKNKSNEPLYWGKYWCICSVCASVFLKVCVGLCKCMYVCMCACVMAFSPFSMKCLQVWVWLIESQAVIHGSSRCITLVSWEDQSDAGETTNGGTVWDCLVGRRRNKWKWERVRQ